MVKYGVMPTFSHVFVFSSCWWDPSFFVALWTFYRTLVGEDTGFSYRVLLNLSPCFKSRHPQFCDHEILGKGYLSHESVPTAVNFLAQRPFCGVWNMALTCGHRAPPNWAFWYRTYMKNHENMFFLCITGWNGSRTTFQDLVLCSALNVVGIWLSIPCHGGPNIFSFLPDVVLFVRGFVAVKYRPYGNHMSYLKKYIYI